MLQRAEIVLPLILLILCWPFACKGPTPAPTYSCDGILHDKPLANIQACVAGNWKMHYRAGGIAMVKEYVTNTYLSIKQNDSIYYTYDGNLVVKTKINWQHVNSIYGMTYSMSYSDLNGYPYAEVVEQIKSDTLVLVDNSSDPFGYYFTRTDK